MKCAASMRFKISLLLLVVLNFFIEVWCAPVSVLEKKDGGKRTLDFYQHLIRDRSITFASSEYIKEFMKKISELDIEKISRCNSDPCLEECRGIVYMIWPKQTNSNALTEDELERYMRCDFEPYWYDCQEILTSYESECITLQPAITRPSTIYEITRSTSTITSDETTTTTIKPLSPTLLLRTSTTSTVSPETESTTSSSTTSTTPILNKILSTTTTPTTPISSNLNEDLISTIEEDLPLLPDVPSLHVNLDNGAIQSLNNNNLSTSYETETSTSTIKSSETTTAKIKPLSPTLSLTTSTTSTVTSDIESKTLSSYANQSNGTIQISKDDKNDVQIDEHDVSLKKKDKDGDNEATHKHNTDNVDNAVKTDKIMEYKEDYDICEEYYYMSEY